MPPSILYNNLFDSAVSVSLVADSTATGFDVNNVSDLRPYTLWKSASTASQYITIDTGTLLTDDSTQIPDTLVLMNHIFAPADKISLQSSADNITYVGVIPDFTVISASNTVTYKEFTGSNHRYWRLHMTNLLAAPPSIGILMLGARLTFERSPLGEFDPIGETSVTTSQKGSTGQLLGVATSFVKKEISPEFITSESWFTTNFKPAWDSHLSLSKPFIWVYDSVSDFHFVRLKDGSKLNAPFISPTLRKIQLRIEGVVE